jgi:hypothetical protein
MDDSPILAGSKLDQYCNAAFGCIAFYLVTQYRIKCCHCWYRLSSQRVAAEKLQLRVSTFTTDPSRTISCLYLPDIVYDVLRQTYPAVI